MTANAYRTARDILARAPEHDGDDGLVELVIGDIAERPPQQRHTEARAILAERRAELVQLADLMRERDGTVVDPERLLAEDKLAIALRAIIDT